MSGEASGSSYEAVPLASDERRDDETMLATAERLLAAHRTRRSIREFAPDPVPEPVVRACIALAATAPSGANQQPWHFVAVRDGAAKARIREAAEVEERAFYDGGGGDAWLRALEPIGTGSSKPHLTIAPWLIVIFAERYRIEPDGSRGKNYYVNESVGIATGFLIAALHACGLSSLTHTPNPMGFLNELCGRPSNEKPVMILAVGHPAKGATYPKAAAKKKPLEDVLSVV